MILSSLEAACTCHDDAGLLAVAEPAQLRRARTFQRGVEDRRWYGPGSRPPRVTSRRLSRARGAGAQCGRQLLVRRADAAPGRPLLRQRHAVTLTDWHAQHSGHQRRGPRRVLVLAGSTACHGQRTTPEFSTTADRPLAWASPSHRRGPRCSRCAPRSPAAVTRFCPPTWRTWGDDRSSTSRSAPSRCSTSSPPSSSCSARWPPNPSTWSSPSDRTTTPHRWPIAGRPSTWPAG
jgi:hypothetical protein